MKKTREGREVYSAHNKGWNGNIEFLTVYTDDIVANDESVYLVDVYWCTIYKIAKSFLLYDFSDYDELEALETLIEERGFKIPEDLSIDPHVLAEYPDIISIIRSEFNCNGIIYDKYTRVIFNPDDNLTIEGEFKLD